MRLGNSLRRTLSWLGVAAAVCLLAVPAGADPTNEETPPPVVQGEGGGGGAAAVGGAGGSGGAPEGRPARRRPHKQRRGGVNPCMTPDPGFGAYDRWVNVSTGQM